MEQMENEGKIYAVHIRKQGNRHGTTLMNVSWILNGVILGLAILAAVGAMVYTSHKFGTIQWIYLAVILVLIYNFIWYEFFVFVMPDKCGELRLNGGIFFDSGRVFPMRIGRGKYAYRDVYGIYIGKCPICYMRWNMRADDTVTTFQEGWAPVRSWSKCYGQNYIVLMRDMYHAMAVCDYNEEAWNILTEKCRNAFVFATEEEWKKARKKGFHIM